MRLANLMQLSHNASVDLYCEEIIAKARLVIVRLLGGEVLLALWSRADRRDLRGPPARRWVLLPGDDQPDPELAAHSTVNPRVVPAALELPASRRRPQNARGFLAFAASLLGRRFDWREPAELPRAGICWERSGIAAYQPHPRHPRLIRDRR